MAQKKKQLVAEGKLDKHGRPNENTPKEYLRSLPDVAAPKVSCSHSPQHALLWTLMYLKEMQFALMQKCAICSYTRSILLFVLNACEMH